MRNAIVDQILMERMNRRGGYDGRDYYCIAEDE